MSAFESQWADWQPKEPTQRTDRTDKSPSVSFVSGSPRHISSPEGASVSFVSGSPKRILPPEREGGCSKGPKALTDKTDRRCPAGGHAVLVQVPAGGVPADWVQGVANLLAMPSHPDWPEPEWKTLQRDALVFLREWACQAHSLGWDSLDLFGIHTAAPHARLDGIGLVPLLGGRPVVAITEGSAAISAISGGTLAYHRKKTWPPGCCPVWELEGRS